MDIIVTLWRVVTDDADTDVFIVTSVLVVVTLARIQSRFFCVNLGSL